METNIIVVNELQESKNWVKETLDAARAINKNSFLFFKHEFIKREKQIRAHLDSYGASSITSLFARKCKVNQIEISALRKFCDEYHIQGSNKLGFIGFGVFYEDELLGVLSLGRHHRNNEDVLLDRMCFKTNIRVVGGASKLFNAAVIWAKTNGINQIISFSDNRYSLGNVYEKLGFALEAELAPDYFYVERNNIEKAYSKQSQKKQNVKCPNGMTERQWAEQRGLVQVYDAGKKRWVYKLRRNVINSFITRRHGFYRTKKGKPQLMYYQSSYELRAAVLLDENENVDFYTTQITFSIDGRERIIDFIVTYKDGSISIVETKPKRQVAKCMQQIEDNRKLARKNGWGFSLWLENELGWKSDHEAVRWADAFISNLQEEIDYVEIRKQKNRESAKAHYQKHIATDKVEIYCEFCKETHNPLRLTYDKNIERNGRYICEKEGGHIAGSKAKPHLRKENPYVNEGKKQCNKCEQIKLFEEFSPDKSRRDGYCSNCKMCRSEKMKVAYEQKKNIKI